MTYINYAMGVVILSAFGAVYQGIKMIIENNQTGIGLLAGGIIVLGILSAFFFKK